MRETPAARAIKDYPPPGSIRDPEVTVMLERRAERFARMSHRYFSAKVKNSK